jgi:hypothetical protein
VRRLIEDIWNTSDNSLLETVAAPGFAESTKQAHPDDAAARPRDRAVFENPMWPKRLTVL